MGESLKWNVFRKILAQVSLTKIASKLVLFIQVRFRFNIVTYSIVPLPALPGLFLGNG